jgi:hypothetical protein
MKFVSYCETVYQLKVTNLINERKLSKVTGLILRYSLVTEVCRNYHLSRVKCNTKMSLLYSCVNFTDGVVC